MDTSAYTVALYAHGITPVPLAEQHEFTDPTAPIDELQLENDLIWARYSVRKYPDLAPAARRRNLLILSVDDRDPVGASDRLLNWTYAGTFEITGEIRHVWWYFQPPPELTPVQP